MLSLTDGSVRRRLFELWSPMIGGVLAVKAIGISDAYFIGQLGSEPLAAISFTFPIVATLISLAIGLSAGASSVLSRAVGSGADTDKQQGIVTGAIVMAAIVAILLAVLGYFSSDLILRLLGARDSALASATLYMQTWFLGSVFLIVPIAINGLLRAAGHGLPPAVLMVVMAVMNIGLNPLFIFGLGPIDGFGVQGAAIATIIARGIGMLASLAIIARYRLLSVSWTKLKEGLNHWREVVRVGLPASLSTSLNPVAISLATAAVATLGSQSVAAFGVATKIQSFALVPLLALSAASSPFVGQNSGAGATHRSRRALYWCSGISVAWSIAIAAILLLFGDRVVQVFSDDPAIQRDAALYLAIVPLSYAGYGVTIALSSAMNGLGRSGTSLAIGGGRAIGLLAPAAWIGVFFGGFAGVAIGTAAANGIAGLAALLTIRWHSLTTRQRAVDMNIAESD